MPTKPTIVTGTLGAALLAAATVAGDGNPINGAAYMAGWVAGIVTENATPPSDKLRNPALR